MHIFDAHTHFFGRIYYECQARQAKRGDVATLLERLARNGVEVPGPDVSAHRDRIIRDLDANGIDRAIAFASIPEEMETVGEAARSSGGRLVAYAAVDPLRPDTVRTLEDLQPTLRFAGILLFPAMHDYGIRDPSVNPVLSLARKHRLVVFVHCGLLRVSTRAILGLNPDFPLHRGHPEDLIPVAREHPDVRFVVPHFGAGFFDELLRLGTECPNVYVDTAGSNTWGLFQAPELHVADLFEQTAAVFGITRILYGSDSAGYPRGYRRDILDGQLRAMHDAGIAPADQELILGGNLARLLEV